MVAERDNDHSDHDRVHATCTKNRVTKVSKEQDGKHKEAAGERRAVRRDGVPRQAERHVRC